MQSATVSLKLESKDFAARANDASTALLGVQIAAGGTGLALKGMGAIARSRAAEFTLGAVAIDKFNTSLGKAATSASRISSIAGNLSNFAYNLALTTTAIQGVVTAAEQMSRIPQAIAAMNASGVSTQTIAEFNQMKAAIGGNQIAVEGFVNTAIARLGEFEKAAARSATILKSNTRFDEQGNALRVNKQETLANALSIQKLVTDKLDNAVTSSSALLAQYEVLSAGFAQQADSEKVLETALKLTQIGRAGGVASDAGDNAKLVGKSLQAYNLNANDAARTGAILNEVVAQGITTIPELSNGFGAAGASASKAGISMSALGAGVAQLTSLGQDTAEALTGLKGLSDTIINKTPEAAAELAKLSLDGQRIRFDVAEIQAKGLVKALLDLNKAAGNSPQILAKIFPDAVTSRAVTGLLSGSGAGLQARFAAIDSASAASLDEVAKNASDTQTNRMEKLANKFGELVIQIAQNVAPVAEPGLAALKAIADGFSAIPDPIKQAIGSWIDAQITIQSTTTAIGILVKTLGDLAGIYAIGRLTSLALSGQLGAEVTVIKELIVQRKGLASVLLQTIGINQRHRLSVDAATAALTNQGLVAKGAYAAQAKGTELLAAASAKARSIFAQNVAGAKAAAAEFSQTPTAGRAVNAGLGVADRARNIAQNIANSETAQNVKSSVAGFLERNPYITTAANEIKSAAQSGLDRIKTEASKLGATVAPQVEEKIKSAASAAADLADEIALRSPQRVFHQAIATPDPKALRLKQLVDAELKLNQSKLLKATSENRAKFAELDKDLAFKQRLQNSKKAELAKREDRFSKQSERLEELKDKLSPEAYQKSVQKLNRDAIKLEELRSSIKENAQPLADLQSDRARAARKLTSSDSQLNAATAAAQEKYGELVNIEARAARVSDAAEKAKQKALDLEAYATNINKIAPNSPQAIAANNAAVNAAIKQSSLTGRAQAIGSQYQELLTSTGGRTALLAQQGLAQVRYGNGLATYSVNSKLESLLYADVGKSVKGALESATKVIGGLSLSGTFIYLRTTAQAAATALGNLTEKGLIKSLREGLTELPGKVKGFGASALAGAKEAYSKGGAIGVARAGYGSVVTGAENLGKAALPFLPSAVAGAIVLPAAAAAIGAIVLRDDFKRAQLAGEFRSSVEATLKRDDELRAKYEERNRPIAELKAAVAAIAEGKSANFSEKSTRTETNLAGGAVDNALSATGKIGSSIGSLPGAIGNALDRTVAEKFELTGKSSLKAIDPVREQLKILAESGQLTGAQFRELDSTLSSMGKNGKISAEELAKFNAQLGKVAAQEKPQARGVVDTIGNAIYNLPGAIGKATMQTVDDAANLTGAILTLRSTSEVAKNREADSLISYLGDGRKEGSLSALINRIGDARVDTSKFLSTYRAGGALDKTNADKIKSGTELTSADIDREKIQTTARIDRNNALVADYDKTISDLNQQLEKQKDPGNKELLQNRIDLYTSQKEALVKNTEALKNAEAAFTKYNSETLPNLIRALKETQDPAKAVALASEDFNNIFQKDATGATTNYVKDIAQLRAESGKYIEAVATKYSSDNSAGADAEAIEKLKSIRDNRITLPNGESGYRDTLSSRMALTDQIVKIQQAESQKLIAAKTLENEKLKTLTADGKLADREAQLKAQDISIEIANENLKAKEKEIREYAQFPRKVVELEQEAAKMRVQIEQQVADKNKAIRERAFALAQEKYDLQAEYLKTAQARLEIGGVAAIEAQSKIDLNKAANALRKLYEDRSRLTEASPELNNQIAKAEQQYRQTQANYQTQIFDARQNLNKQLIGLDATRQTQPLTIENKQLESAQKLKDIQANILSANKEILNSNLDIQQAQLSNESKLSNTAVKRAQIEATSARAKLNSLDAVQAYERQSLILQQELTELSFKSQQNQLNISRIEQQRTIKELELQKLKLDRDKSNSPEVQAQRQELAYQTEAARIQLANLDTQAGVLDKQIVANKQIADAKLKQNTATTANAKETERINVLLADINLKTAKIAENNERQNLAFNGQVQALNRRSNILEIDTKRLETQTKFLTAQQGLASAIGDARVGELTAMTNLTSIEGVKFNIAQQMAAVKLSSLTTQIKYEKDILELNIQQQQATYEQDKIKQQIAEKNAERDVINSRAAYEKLLAKGNLADPNEKKAAELDLAAKLDAQALTRSNRDILAQQGQFINYSAQVERIKLDVTQKGKLQTGLAEYGAALGDGTARRAEFENSLFNSMAQQQGTKYYQDWANSVIGAAKANPIVLPQFNSAYDPRSNYNRPGVANPEKLNVDPAVNYRSGAGSVEFSPPLISPAANNYAKYQQDAQARYAELVQQPIKFEVNTPAIATRRGADSGKNQQPVKPIVLNLQMTNDLKLTVNSSQEAKEKFVDSNLAAIDEVVRLAKQMAGN